jgi:general stress protein 26
MLTPEYVLEVAKHTITATEYCFFMTQGTTGQIHARLMQPFAPEEDLTLWFGTSPRSRKVRDLQQQCLVTVAFHQPIANAYVALVGLAQVEDNLTARWQRWREEWRRFFPAGPAGEDYVLIKVVPERLEVMSFVRQVTPPPFGLRPAVLVRSGDVWILEGPSDQ